MMNYFVVLLSGGLVLTQSQEFEATMAPSESCECDVCQETLNLQETGQVTGLWLIAVLVCIVVYYIAKKCDREHDLRTIESFNRSGVLVILWSCAWAFLIPFHALLASSRPCATALGDCSTISCVSANRYFQGYVFMFVALTLIAVLLTKDLSDAVLIRKNQTFEKKDPYFKSYKALCAYFAVVFGLLALTLTAIFPSLSHDAYGPNDQLPAERDLVLLVGRLHIFGILIGCLILFLVPYMLSYYTRTLRKRNICACGRILIAIAWLVYVALFGVSYAFADENNLIHNYCAFAETESECEHFPYFLDGSCLLNRRPFRYECEWFTGIESTQVDDYCRKSSCKLLENSRIMVLEFCALLITLINFVHFGLPDTKAYINLRNENIVSPDSCTLRPKDSDFFFANQIATLESNLENLARRLDNAPHNQNRGEDKEEDIMLLRQTTATNADEETPPTYSV